MISTMELPLHAECDRFGNCHSNRILEIYGAAKTSPSISELSSTSQRAGRKADNASNSIALDSWILEG